MRPMRFVSRLALPAACLGLAGLVLAAGCVPNRMAVSRDGRTLYFSRGSLSDDKGADVYALSVEDVHLKALTGGGGMKTWCALGPEGDLLLYMQGEGIIQMLDVKGGDSTPVTGLLHPLSYPWVVPAEAADMAYLLAVKMDEDGGGRWQLFTPPHLAPVDLALPEDEAAVGPGGKGTEWVAARPNRFAMATLRPLPEPEASGKPAGARPDAGAAKAADAAEAPASPAEAPEAKAPPAPNAELSVWVVDMTGAPPSPDDGQAEVKLEARPRRVATWRVRHQPSQQGASRGEAATIALAFSPDGKRLAASPLVPGSGWESGRVYEVDLAGEAEPRLLIEDSEPGVEAGAITWSPDGKDLVYLRRSMPDARDEPVEIVRRPAGGGEAKLLARLDATDGAVAWHWMEDGSLRAFFAGKQGELWWVEAPAGAGEAKVRRLPADRLSVLQRLADLERAAMAIPGDSGHEWPADVKGRMAEIDAWVSNLREEGPPESVRTAAKEALEMAARWEEVPAIYEPPAEAPPAEAPAGAEKAAGEEKGE